MEVTRKEFVGGMLAGLAASLASPAILFGQSERQAAKNGFSLAGFQALVNTQFRFGAVDGAKPATLILASALDSGSTAQTEQFSLQFLSRDGLRIEPGTYTVQRSGVGTFSLYIVPSRVASEGTYYRADFNLLRSGVSASRH